MLRIIPLLLWVNIMTTAQALGRQGERDVRQQGVSAYEQGEYEKAIAYFDYWLARHPNDGKIYWYRGNSHLALKQFPEADIDFTAFLKFDPNLREAYFERGRVRYRLKHFELAKLDFEAFIQAPDRETSQIYYRQAATGQGVLGVFTMQNGNASLAYYHLALCHIQLEEYHQALALLDSALVHSPGDADIYSEKGKALAALGEKDQASLAYQKALEIDPEHFLTRQRLAFLNKDDHQEVLEELTLAIASAPQNPETFRQRGYFRLMHQDPKGALEDFDQAIRLDAEDPMLWFYRGKSNYAMENFSQAEKDFSKAIVFDDKEPEFLLARGQARYKLNEYRNALADFTLLTIYDPYHPRSYYHKGITLHRISGRGAGCADLLRAKEMGMAEAAQAWSLACGSDAHD